VARFLGHLWQHFGPFVATFWAVFGNILGHLWQHFGRFCYILGHFGGHLWQHFGPFLLHFGGHKHLVTLPETLIRAKLLIAGQRVLLFFLAKLLHTPVQPELHQKDLNYFWLHTSWAAGLPDFSWCNIPKRGKIYHMSTKWI
jgi:hypothetical protein